VRLAAALLAAFAAALALAAPAPAAGTPGSAPRDPNALVSPARYDRPPPGRALTADRAIAIARAVPKVRDVLRRHPGWTRAAYTKGQANWQVSFFERRRRGQARREIAQVQIEDRRGRVPEAWTGFQVAWTMARGYEGAFGRKANALYVWIPLCVLFVLPFVDPRRLARWRHLDLLAIVALSASLGLFNRGEIGWSVPLAYPPLVYLLVRMLALARVRAREPPRLLVPVTWLAVALIFLVGFRIGLNLANSNVIDVGYAGVIGADRLTDGDRLYGQFPHDNDHGDTYGPVNYYAYVPFEQAFPWSGRWDDLPAAHGAAVAFDLAAILALWLLGRRLGGRALGVALAYAWAACPWTLFALSSNSNDTLVAALVAAALLVAGRPAARGALAALAALTKFAPLALAPLLATYRPAGSSRGRAGAVARFALGFGLAGAAALAPVVLGDDLRTFYERTFEFQSERGSPFSIWGFEGDLGTVQAAVKAAAVALALLVAFVPRRRDLVSLAALGAAVTIAVQLGVTHWFYLYVVWFLPLALVAILAPREPAPAPALSSPPAPAATP
jgi:hypothetical protein